MTKGISIGKHTWRESLRRRAPDSFFKKLFSYGDKSVIASFFCLGTSSLPHERIVFQTIWFSLKISWNARLELLIWVSTAAFRASASAAMTAFRMASCSATHSQSR